MATKIGINGFGRIGRSFDNRMTDRCLLGGLLVGSFLFFPQQQTAMGSLHNIDFGVCWASWGGSGKKTGSGKVP